MAVVQLADIYEPLTFNGAVQERAIELNRFVQSGIMVDDPLIASVANSPGQTHELPFFHGLTHDEPDYVTDDPAVDSVPAKLTGGKQLCFTAYTHKSWSTMDLAREIALQDPLMAITDRVAKYFAVNTEKRLINSAIGIMLDNVANDSSDMTNDIFTETGLSATAANLISAEEVVDTVATLGDHSEIIAAIAMHSVPYFNLVKADLIVYVKDSTGSLSIPTYLGKRVVVDDSIAPRAGTTNGFVYTTIMFSSGCIAYGRGTPTVPSELERKASSGNGGGQDILHYRTTELIHPFGFAFDPTSVAGQSATYAELAAAAQWNRVMANRKNIGIAFLRTNG